MSEAVMGLATRLGKAIADSPAAKNMDAARKAMEIEKGTSDLLEQFQEHSMKIARLEAENKPVEVDDKHTLQALHEKLIASEVFKQFTAAQVEYADLMRRVNEAIQGEMTDVDA